MKTLKSLIFCLIVILGVSSFAKAAPLSQAPSILYVMEGETGNCSGWATACDLQTALTEANPGDQVWVAAGIYKPNTLSDREATFTLISGVAIYGGFQAAGGALAERNWVANLTTLSGNIGNSGDSTDNSYHVVSGYGVDGTAIMDSFTISGGNASVLSSTNYYGGGMYNSSSSPTLTNIIFSTNSATQGGGMYNGYGSPTLTNVTFSGNSAYYGGGMFNCSSGPTLTNVTFSANPASYGGGMWNFSTSPTLTNAILWGNSPDQIYGSSAIVSYSDVQGGYTGTNNISDDPLLGILTNNGGFTQTHALRSGSKAIDTANPAFCLTYDQRFYTRPIDGDGNGSKICDMGAYDYRSSVDGFTLTVEKVGSGSVIKNPVKLGYRYGEVVTLTANPGWTFSSWGGDATGAINPLTITIDRITKIAANFTQDDYSLTTTVNPSGMGSVNVGPVQTIYHYGDVVTLTPTPTTGWTFSGWSGDATGTANPLTMNIQGNTNITANFSDQYTLSAIVVPLGSGTVTRNPSEATYTYGTPVALTANPNPGWTFSGWNGDTTSIESPMTITIEVDTNVTANFTQNEYTLTVLVNPEEAGTVARSPDQTTYTYETPVTLTATANSGWTFSGWSGDATGTVNPLTMNIPGNTNITANFTRIYKLYLPLVIRN